MVEAGSASSWDGHDRQQGWGAFDLAGHDQADQCTQRAGDQRGGREQQGPPAGLHDVDQGRGLVRVPSLLRRDEIGELCHTWVGEDVLQEAVVAARERVLGSEHPHTLNSCDHLGAAYLDAGRVDEATKLFEEVLAAQERVLGSEHPDTLTSRDNLAVAYLDAGRVDEATKLFEEVLAARERVLGSEHPHTLTSRHNLAALYRDGGRNVDRGAPREAP